MNRSDSVASLLKAFVSAQGSMQVAIKDSTNPHFKSRYADLGAVWAACRDVLSNNGLAVIQYPCDAENNRLGMTTMLVHTSGEFMAFPPFSTALAKNDPQGVGSAITYLKRYALCAALGIVADDDDDANAASHSKESKHDAPKKYAGNASISLGQAAGASTSVSSDRGHPSKVDQAKQLLASAQDERAALAALKSLQLSESEKKMVTPLYQQRIAELTKVTQ